MFQCWQREKIVIKIANNKTTCAHMLYRTRNILSNSFYVSKEEQESRKAKRGSRSIRTATLASISHRSAVVDVTVSRCTRSAARFAITISASDRCGCAHIGFRARQQRGAKRDESTDAIARDGDEESRKEGESERSCQPPSQYGSLLHQAASFPIICHSLT